MKSVFIFANSADRDMKCHFMLARGLSYVQVDTHGLIFYTTYISVGLAHHEIFPAKVGKGGIKQNTLTCMHSVKCAEIYESFGALSLLLK